MKKNERQKKQSKKSVIITVITLLAGVLSIFAVGSIAVGITVYEIPIDSVMKPFGPITIEHTFKECLPTDPANSGVFNNNNTEVDLELYMATYMQEVEGEYQVIIDNQILPDDRIDEPDIDKVSCGEGCERNYLDKEVFGANTVHDNKYKRVVALNTDVMKQEKICLHIRPLYQNPTHPLTIWMNSQNEPVLRLKREIPLYQAADYLSRQSQFHLGKELMFGLCLAYILGLIGFAGFICKSVYEQKYQKQELQTKSQHHSGTGDKRI